MMCSIGPPWTDRRSPGSMSAEVDLLRRIAARRETEADRLILADRIRTYLQSAPDGLTLDSAFGLIARSGEHRWWRTEALRTRDAAIRALAAAFYPDRSHAKQAAEIRAALLAYRTTTWRFDRCLTEPPARYLGTAREIMFDCMRACDVVPSERQVRRILRD